MDKIGLAVKIILCATLIARPDLPAEPSSSLNSKMVGDS